MAPCVSKYTLLYLLLLCTCSPCFETESLEIRMPPYEVESEDTYLCTAVQLPPTPKKLVGVEPQSEQNTVHHMLLFGCETPVGDENPWICKHTKRCKDQDSIIYGWGRNAPAIYYPDGVAFSVGEGTSIRALVLQVHYLTKRPQNDTSGIVLKFSEEPLEKAASVVEFVASFEIPPGKARHPVEVECCYSGFEPLTTLAFRVHTHEMGRKVYMTKRNLSESEETVIAERNPLLPQGFVEVGKKEKWFPGTRLKVTCDFDSSDRMEAVRSGFGHSDEMCNMYMITYSDIPQFGDCIDGVGFYVAQKTGILQGDHAFRNENSLSNFWGGPDIRISEDFGQGASVDRGHDGHIWYLHRGENTMDMVKRDGQLHVRDRSLITTTPVLLLNPTTGEVVSRWGANFFSVPHMLSVAPDGNVWITDVGKHQVFKFAPDGELLLTLGRAFEPGSGPDKFCAPTEVSALTDGSILVSDGYCNKRIARFSSDGEFMNEIRDPTLSIVHSVVADECDELFYVADRENGRVAVYRLSTLEPLGSLQLAGRVLAVTRGPYSTYLALVEEMPGADADIYQIEATSTTVHILHSWKVTGCQFPHDLTLSAAPFELTGAGGRLFAVYIAEINGMKLSKFILTPPDFRPPQLSQPQILPFVADLRHAGTAVQAKAITDLQSDLNAETAALLEAVTGREERPQNHNLTFQLSAASVPSAGSLNAFGLVCSAAVFVVLYWYMKNRRHKH